MSIVALWLKRGYKGSPVVTIPVELQDDDLSTELTDDDNITYLTDDIP